MVADCTAVHGSLVVLLAQLYGACCQAHVQLQTAVKVLVVLLRVYFKGLF